MDFARKQLEKYGWKEGQGLGKNEDGIANPIKPRLKFDNTGIGHDHGAQFTNKWWETVFNNATKNIDVNIENDTVNLALKGKPVEITTKSYSIKKGDKHSLYGSFYKTSKLTNKGTERFDVEIEETSKKYTELTDEELFAACGGRTAHKGARHGLKLSGKLSRIEKQEKLLMKRMKNVNLDDEAKIVKKMKRLHLEKEKLENVDGFVSDSSSSSTKKKKKKGKKSVSFNETVLEYHIPSCEENEPSPAEQAEAANNDEGIELDVEENNNQEEEDSKSFDEPHFVVSDLSNAERKKLKKKRKHDGKNRPTTKFIQAVQAEMMEVSGKGKCECKKRKLSNVKDPDNKRSQSTAESPERLRRKKDKKKKDKKNKKSEDRKIRNIAISLDNFCKISDDL